MVRSCDARLLPPDGRDPAAPPVPGPGEEGEIPEVQLLQLPRSRRATNRPSGPVVADALAAGSAQLRPIAETVTPATGLPSASTTLPAGSEARQRPGPCGDQHRGQAPPAFLTEVHMPRCRENPHDSAPGRNGPAWISRRSDTGSPASKADPEVRDRNGAPRRLVQARLSRTIRGLDKVPAATARRQRKVVGQHERDPRGPSRAERPDPETEVAFSPVESAVADASGPVAWCGP